MEAYSPDTDTTYPSWDDLIAAETNGFVIVAQSSQRGTLPFVIGPFESREEANRVRVRRRRKWLKEEAPYEVKTWVRHLWKDIQ